MTLEKNITGAVNDKAVKKEEVLNNTTQTRRILSEKLVKDLMKVLNEVHNKNLSLRFWKIVLKPYLTAAISGKKVLEKENLNLIPHLIPINAIGSLTAQKKFEANLIRYVKHFKTFFEAGNIEKIISGNNNLLLTFPELGDIKRKLGTELPTRYPLFTGKKNKSARERANNIAEKQSDVFLKNAIKQLPQIYLEYFDSLFDSIKLINPKEKIFHIHSLQSTYMDFLIAKYIENGAKLYWYQHGGCYGEYAFHSSHQAESDLADEFRTWGWKIRENDVPWKAYRLEKFKQNYDSIKAGIKYDILLCFTIIYPGNREFLVEKTKQLLSQLDKNKYKTFLARPRPTNKIRSFKHYIDFIDDPKVEKDSGLTNMTQVVKESKLVFQFEVPSTNFLECIYIDHPVIGYLTNTENPSEIVKPHYEFLLKNGVLHTSFDSLISHLNNIDVDTWWSELIAKPEYISFKNTFAKKV